MAMLESDEKQAEVTGWICLGTGVGLLVFLSVWLFKAAVFGVAVWGY